MSFMRMKLQEKFYNLPYFMRNIMINLYGYTLAKKRFDGKFREYYEFFQRTQWWSPEELSKFQIERLRRIIDIAYKNVPYYRKIFNEFGLVPDDFNTIEDLKKIPKLNKDIIRKNWRSLVNERFPRSRRIKHYSSGTTGQKLEFYLPKELAYSINFAMLYRFYNWARIKLGEKRVTIGGRIFTKRPPFWVFNKAENQLLLSIHHLNEKTVDEYIEKIKEFLPTFIQGHPTGIYFISKRLLDLGITIPVKAVFTTGETLFDYQRNTIMKAFECEVFESYGAGESVISAFECEKHAGFHEASEYGIIEFDKDQSGLYRVIGTSLWNEAMPFIRYEIEDLVEISESYKCDCRRGLPIKIKKIIGRIDDILTSPDGVSILPVTIRMAIKPFLNVFESYQFIQISKNEYIFYITGNITREREVSILNILKDILGENARIQFSKVDNNIITQSGKVRNVINLYKQKEI